MISRDETPLHIEPKTMQVLVCLAQHSGAVVSKEELLRAVWPDTFVSEHVLTHAIWQLRHVFQDRELIQTVPRHGYRLVVPSPTDTPLTPMLDVEAVRTRAEWSQTRRRSRMEVAAIQTGYAFLAALLVTTFGRIAVAALKEQTMFAHHARLMLVAAAWLMATYSFVTITAALMWLGRARCFAAFDRYFAVFCPVNLLSGLFLLVASGDGLYWVIGSAPALVVCLLLLPFVLYAPFYQRRIIRRNRLGTVLP